MSASRSTPRLRLTAVLLAGVLALVAVSSRTAADGIAGIAMQLAGLACVVCAALGRAWTSVFIAGYKDTQLVRRGPYAMLRHPLYALSLLAMLGIGLTTRSLALTALLLAAFMVLYATAARAEDRFLLGRHGPAFAAYASEVRAFLPRWSAYEVPEALDVRPRVLWKAFLDAGTLLGLWALLLLVDALQVAGRLPTWIALP
jgi:protein-S-isoprenylcysteine O-methyltransferase Ste14